jgi:predicted nucleotidyltransferase
MNLEIKSIRNKLNKIIKKDNILDVILFGSSIKGKPAPGDIDIAIISENEIAPDLFNLNGFHFSFLKPLDFFKRRITLLNTLFREGYSLKFNKPFSELYGFKNKVLFIYELKGLNSSKKVKIVNILRGKKNSNGLVAENNGNWLANRVFVIPVNHEYILENFFVRFGIKFVKYYALMH